MKHIYILDCSHILVRAYMRSFIGISCPPNNNRHTIEWPKYHANYQSITLSDSYRLLLNGIQWPRTFIQQYIDNHKHIKSENISRIRHLLIGNKRQQLHGCAYAHVSVCMGEWIYASILNELRDACAKTIICSFFPFKKKYLTQINLLFCSFSRLHIHFEQLKFVTFVSHCHGRYFFWLWWSASVYCCYCCSVIKCRSWAIERVRTKFVYLHSNVLWKTMKKNRRCPINVYL